MGAARAGRRAAAKCHLQISEGVAQEQSGLLSGRRGGTRVGGGPGYGCDRVEAGQSGAEAGRPGTKSRAAAALRIVAAGSSLRPDHPASHSILDFALDASGAQLAFGTKNSKVVLYDTASGAAVARLENDAPIVQLAFSPDGGGLFGRTDATGDKQAGAARRLGLVEWRRASDGSWSRQSERSMPNLRRLISTSHGVIAPIEDRSRGEFRLRDAATDRLLATVPLVPDEASPRDLDVSFDCGLAATASEGATNHAETTIDVWDVAAHRRLIRLAPGIGEIHHVSFSPDARYLACTSANGVIAYETTEFKPATTYRGWLSAAAVWAGDGTTLAVPLSQENGQFKVGLGPARSARMADCFWLPEIA